MLGLQTMFVEEAIMLHMFWYKIASSSNFRLNFDPMCFGDLVVAFEYLSLVLLPLRYGTSHDVYI